MKTKSIQLMDGWEAVLYQRWTFPPDLVQAWNSLARDAGDLSVFVGYDWFDAFWRAFARGRELFVIVLTKDGVTKAIFPCSIMAAPADGLAQGVISSLTNYHTYHYDFLIEPKERQDAIPCFIQSLRRLAPNRIVVLECMPSSAPNISLFLRCLRRSGIPVHGYSRPFAPWVNVSGDWDAYYRALPSRLRNDLQRRRRRSEERGRLQFEVIQPADDLDRVLDVVFEVEYRSWKGRAGTAIKCQPEVEQFYRLLAVMATRESRLLLFLLKLDETPIAAYFCLSSAETVFMLKSGYDENFASLSPGTLLHQEIIKYLFGLPKIKVCNLMGTCDSWKMDWTPHSGEYSWLRVYPKTWIGWSLYASELGRAYLKRVNFLRRAKDWIDRKVLQKGAR